MPPVPPESGRRIRPWRTRGWVGREGNHAGENLPGPPEISENLRPVGWGGAAQRGRERPSFLMRDSRVVGLRPSSAAVPAGPRMRLSIPKTHIPVLPGSVETPTADWRWRSPGYPWGSPVGPGAFGCRAVSARTMQLNRRYQRPLVRKGHKKRPAVSKGFRSHPAYASRTISLRGPRPDPQVLARVAVFASFAVKYLVSVVAKARALPCKHGRRLHEDQNSPPVRPVSGQP